MLAMVSYRNNRQMLKNRRKAFNKDRMDKYYLLERTELKNFERSLP